MEFLILNEESFPFCSISSAENSFPQFIRILDSAILNQFKAIRLSGKLDIGWFEIELAEGYTLRKWLVNQETDFTRKVKSVISKTVTPQIPEQEILKSMRFEFSEFFLVEHPEIQTPSLGAAYLLTQIALSLASKVYWHPKLIKICHQELTENQGIENNIVEVNNCSNWEIWQDYLAAIEEEKLQNLRKGNELWAQRNEVFPNLDFVGDTHKQFSRLSLTDTTYSQLYQALKILNEYCTSSSANYSLRDIIGYTGLDISDESDSVKQNPRLKAFRVFKVREERMFFGFHVKNFSGALRLHFKPSSEDRKIFIGYFGKHLPLK